MRFRNRHDAAEQLAARLSDYAGRRPLVLGLPRGGVPMARVVADRLGGDLDVVLVRKLRAPGQPELAIGAVDEAGTVLEGSLIDIASPEYLREEVRAESEIIRARRRLYTRSHPAIDPAGRVAILVDDGIATGSSMLAALRALRRRRPEAIVVATAVAPPGSLVAIRAEADEVVCLHTTEAFGAVGEFFDDFSEVTDDMVVAALSQPGGPAASRPRSRDRGIG